MVHYLKLCVLQVRHSKFEFSSILTFFKLTILQPCLKREKENNNTETLIVHFSVCWCEPGFSEKMLALVACTASTTPPSFNELFRHF